MKQTPRSMNEAWENIEKRMRQEEDEVVVVNTVTDLQVYGLIDEMQGQTAKGTLEICEMPRPKKRYERQEKLFLGSSILDESELEAKAQEQELRKMESDGLYVKMNVAYDADNQPQLTAKTWDGGTTTDVLPYIAHYVSDTKQRGKTMPFDVATAILGIDKKEMEEHYGKGTAQLIRDEVVKLMPNEVGIYKVA